MTIQDYILGVNDNITSKVEPESITANIVGNAFTDLANIVSTLPTGVTTDLSNYYTKLQSDAKYLTGYTVDFSNYYSKSQSDAKYLTGYTVDFSNYYNKSTSDAK